MRISTRGQYGLRAMCFLAMNNSRAPTPLRDISEREGISMQYLEQLFRVLREAGLVESVRGAKGGYLLARDPSEISVGDVVRAVEGPIAPVECVDAGEDGECCERQHSCLTRQAWLRLRDSMVETLDSITLSELCSPALGARTHHHTS